MKSIIILGGQNDSTKKLKKGDTIAVVSLSSGMGGEKEFYHRYLLGKERLEKVFGLRVITMPNALKGVEYLYKHPEARAKDLMDAFKDKRILNKDKYVEYEDIYDSDKAISKCKNFITKDTELVPAWKINEYYSTLEGEDKYTHYIRCLNSLGINNAQTLTDKMIICDYIIANKDRHFNNFGAIRNVNTLKFISIAPIFDNGCSLWYDENDMYVGEFFLTKPFEDYEKKQLSLVKSLDWLDISKLKDFPDEVEAILSLDKLLSKERINKIVNQVKLRIEHISKLKKTLES